MTGRLDDREALIDCYMPLARALAARYRRTPEPFDDLVQVAYVGLGDRQRDRRSVGRSRT